MVSVEDEMRYAADPHLNAAAAYRRFREISFKEETLGLALHYELAYWAMAFGIALALAAWLLLL